MYAGGLVAALLGFSACIPASRPVQTDRGPAGAAAAEQADRRGVAAAGSSLVPAGHGTLRQDEITVTLRSGAVQVKVTPLAEPVIRLTAPDTYRRLHALAESRRAGATPGVAAGEPILLLVSFFSDRPDARFRPEDIQIAQQGRLLRPVSILPVTPGWGLQRTDPQEPQLAVYAFSGAIDVHLPLTIRYGVHTSNAWARLLPTLELERARVRARAGSGAPVR